MSIFSNIGKAIKKGVVDTGHFVGKVASNPIVDAGLAFIPGIGPIAAGAAAGIGRLIAPGGNLGNAARTGITTGIGSGLAHGALGSLTSHIPGVGSILGGGGGATDAIAGDVLPDAARQAVGGGATNGLLGSVGGLVKSAGQYALKNPGNVLTAAEGINSALDSASARSLEKKAMGYSVDDYNSRSGLRSAGTAGLLAPPVDLTQSRAYQSTGNAYATRPKPTSTIFGVTRRQAAS